MNPRIELHPMTRADIPQVIELAGRIWREHYPPIVGAAQVEYMLRNRYTEANLLADVGAGDRWFDVLNVDGESAGFLRCAIEAPGELRLREIYLEARWRGRGLGRRLLEHAEALARAAGCRRIFLTVNKRNAVAIRAYERFGFTIRDSLIIDIGGGFVMDDYRMVKELAAP